ncbi:class I SAM-dependent methyltransferase [Jiangella anatolica]|uniref:Uncharacterized protein n=1 Tax=Jiangella anatolica TaxID=2670374 RepID=A0A2W2C7P5_9ACTN|nr:class I SAM-dependent methyltransferase [Jiangella anatolica]PZF81756.1 hypothetical protein C1I92_19610 [Jiangella anatolica]
MLRAARQFLGSKWTALSLFGAALAVVAAGWALIDDGDVVAAILALLLGLALAGTTVAIAATHQADRRIRSLTDQVERTEAANRETTQALGELRATLADPAGGPLGAILGALRTDTALMHDESAARTERVAADVRTDLAQVRAELAAVTAALTSAAGPQERPEHDAGDLDAMAQDQLSELSALANLYSMFGPADEVPVLGGYAATPRTILRLTSMVGRLPGDALIVECGSGSSTVWLALACQRRGTGRVVALEHHDLYAARTREALARLGLDGVAEVRSAPLEPVTVQGEKHDWYAAPSWADLRGIDLLFVDGPPGKVGPRSRFPALPLLAPALADGAIVALDDAQRPDEADVAADWLSTGADGIQLADDGLVGRTRFFTATRA